MRSLNRMNANVLETLPAPDTLKSAASLRLKALLIEDNALDARLIQIMLNEGGSGQFELERADRLASGLEILARGEINIVLLDLSLPDSTGGLATFKKVHAQAPNLPIIV